MLKSVCAAVRGAMVHRHWPRPIPGNLVPEDGTARQWTGTKKSSEQNAAWSCSHITLDASMSDHSDHCDHGGHLHGKIRLLGQLVNDHRTMRESARDARCEMSPSVPGHMSVVDEGKSRKGATGPRPKGCSMVRRDVPKGPKRSRAVRAVPRPQ